MSECNITTVKHTERVEVLDFPADKEAFIWRALKPLVDAGMFPTWLHELTIWNCGGRDTTDNADVLVRPPYHSAAMHIFDPYWSDQRTDYDRFLTLKHELAHIITGPMDLAMENALECAFPNEADRGPGYKHMKKIFLDAIEFVGCDIERNWPAEWKEQA